jgi:hypothetical protein
LFLCGGSLSRVLDCSSLAAAAAAAAVAGLLAAVEQIAFADRILLNKTDLVSEEEKTDIKARIKVSTVEHSDCRGMLQGCAVCNPCSTLKRSHDTHCQMPLQRLQHSLQRLQCVAE